MTLVNSSVEGLDRPVWHVLFLDAGGRRSPGARGQRRAQRAHRAWLAATLGVPAACMNSDWIWKQVQVVGGRNPQTRPDWTWMPAALDLVDVGDEVDAGCSGASWTRPATRGRSSPGRRRQRAAWLGAAGRAAACPDRATSIETWVMKRMRSGWTRSTRPRRRGSGRLPAVGGQVVVAQERPDSPGRRAPRARRPPAGRLVPLATVQVDDDVSRPHLERAARLVCTLPM